VEATFYKYLWKFLAHNSWREKIGENILKGKKLGKI